MKKIIAPSGDEKNLLAILRREGFPVRATCGGNGQCGRCRVRLDGKEVLACRVELEKEAVVETIGGEALQTKRTEARPFPYSSGFFAVDVGTTTVAVALTDGKEVCDVECFDNPQTAFGGDVLSRIQATKKAGVRALQEPLLKAIGRAVKTLCARHDCRAEKIFVCGNTVMLHLFWGEEVTSLGVAPYTPVFLQNRTGRLPLLDDVPVETLPCVSSFVGADVVAGITLYQPTSSEKIFLIDLGTNAEIALIGKEEILVTSAAAGPCFEGGNVSCGMPASEGAITSFSLEGGKSFSFIGIRPTGVCGSGLIDVVGQLRNSDIIDKTGYLKTENGYPIAGNIVLTQQDVRAYQTARSAVRSGMEILLSESGSTYSDVAKIYLAGGFSARINVRNAVLSGLLPAELQDRCSAVGSSALLGTVRYVLHPEEAQAVIKKARAVDLGGSPAFAEAFIKNMDF